MATWKKLVTYDSNGNVEGSVTGQALGGLSGTLPINKGGTGQATLGDGDVGDLLMWGVSGLECAPAPAGPGKILASKASGTWDWLEISESHNHDASYLPLASNDESIEFAGNLILGGSLEVGGTFYCENFLEVNTASTETAALQAGGDNGDGSGWYIDYDGGADALETSDPCILWETDYLGSGQASFVAGIYGSDMRGFVMSTATTITNPSADVSHPGIIGQDSSSNIYISI